MLLVHHLLLDQGTKSSIGVRLGKHGILTDESFENVDCFGRAVDNVASVGARESNFIVNNAPPFFVGLHVSLKAHM